MKDKTHIRNQIGQAWNKYSLIVVGNIVFFVLLYFFSYRPHNAESRAGELLSMAQSSETRQRYEAAQTLYEKILEDYPSERAAQFAKDRLPKMRQEVEKRPKKIPPCPARCDELNLDEMLRQGPALHIGTFLTKQQKRRPNRTGELAPLIWRYLRSALDEGEIELNDMRAEKAFANPKTQKALFSIAPVCHMEPDWIYDDFKVRNDNFFAWSNVRVVLEVVQKERKEREEIRVEKLGPKEELNLLEFRVKEGQGPVECRVEVTANEGKMIVEKMF